VVFLAIGRWRAVLQVRLWGLVLLVGDARTDSYENNELLPHTSDHHKGRRYKGLVEIVSP